MPVFERVHSLIAEVQPVLAAYAKEQGGEPLATQAYLAELSNRLRGLGVASAMLDELVAEQLTEEVFAHKMDRLARIEIVTEAFYVSAWRMREVARKLPGLKSFNPIGIRDVRNQLIEHPENHDGVLLPSFSLSPEFGPTVKPARSVAYVPSRREHGLRAHAEEFLEGLLGKLQNWRTAQSAGGSHTQSRSRDI